MEGYVAEIRMFAANFAPRNWSYCSGQIMSIAQNTALFSLLGTTFGGNGQTTFGLPDFRGRIAVGTGQGTDGAPNVVLGEMAGQESVQLVTSNLPLHTHTVTGTNSVAVNGTIKATMQVNNAAASTSNPKGNYLGIEGGGNGLYVTSPGNPDTLNAGAIEVAGSTLGVNTASIGISPAGSSMPIDIGMPSLGMNFVICIYGIFPSRN